MYTISYNFDETTGKMSNWKCVKIDTKSKINSNGLPIVEVGENKLIISPEAVALIEASAGDRVSIRYVQKSKELTIPVIAKSELLVDKDAGNKLTLSNTVSFKGKQRTMLLEYGSIFKLEPSDKEKVFKLVPTSDDSSTELNSEELQPELTDLDFDNFEELDKLPF